MPHQSLQGFGKLPASERSSGSRVPSDPDRLIELSGAVKIPTPVANTVYMGCTLASSSFCPSRCALALDPGHYSGHWHNSAATGWSATYRTVACRDRSSRTHPCAGLGTVSRHERAVGPVVGTVEKGPLSAVTALGEVVGISGYHNAGHSGHRSSSLIVTRLSAVLRTAAGIKYRVFRKSCG